MSEPMPHGSFVWNELMTGDVAKAKEFYTKLLGWETADMPMGDFNYTVFKTGDMDAGGMMAITPEMGDVPPHWMSYIKVENVDTTAAKIDELGGKIVVPPTDILNIGRFCTLIDPTGAAVSIFTPLPKK